VELTRLALEEGGICNQVVVVRDGVEALDYLFGRGKFTKRDLSKIPAVILLDLKLPKVDGLEVLTQVRADPKTHCLPVVILTSSREEEDIIKSYDLGANAYVRKPVDYNEFVRAAKTLGLFWLVVNQPPPGRRS
jgi:two-component system, response regulator